MARAKYGKRSRAVDLEVHAFGDWIKVTVDLSQSVCDNLSSADWQKRGKAVASLACQVKAKLWVTRQVDAYGLRFFERDFRNIVVREHAPRPLKSGQKDEAASEAAAPPLVEGDVIELPMQPELDFDITGPARE